MTLFTVVLLVVNNKNEAGSLVVTLAFKCLFTLSKKCYFGIRKPQDSFFFRSYNNDGAQKKKGAIITFMSD